MSADSPDKIRRGTRVHHAFLFRYRLSDANKTWRVSPLRDLSSGGARFLSEYAFGVGETIEAQLMLPAEKDPVAITARVAWTNRSPLAAVEVGVTFDVGDPAIQLAIDQAITHLLTARRGRRKRVV